MPQRPKRHHQVPRSFLNRFGTGEKVRVRWRDGRSFATGTINVAVESGFYDLPDPAGGVSSRVEEALAEVDGAAVEAMATIDRTGIAPAEGSDARFVLAVFLGLELTRTTQHRKQVMFPQRVAAWAGGREISERLVAEYLEQVHLGFPPRRREAEGAHAYITEMLKGGTDLAEVAVEMILKMVEAYVPRLLAMHWTLELAPQAQFITSDTPVVVWRKPSRMDEFQGVGIDSADELRFPLDPGKQLVLSKRQRTRVLRVQPHRVRRSNADMAAGCHRFIVGRPDQQHLLDAIQLYARPPVIRFNVGPLLVEGGAADKDPDAEVIHMFVPRRPLRR